MAVLSFMDANDFDASKSYFNKLKSKEEVCYLVLKNYTNQPLNSLVKAVIANDGVDEFEQGVLYIKELDHSSSDLPLDDFLEKHVDATDIYTYVIRLEENYNDLRELTRLVALYSDNKLRFIGGNLLALEGTGVGFFPENFIALNKLKVSPSIRFDLTRVKLIDSDTLVTHDYQEFIARKSQVRKSKVTKERKEAKPKKTKTVSKKKNVMDILGSY